MRPQSLSVKMDSDCHHWAISSRFLLLVNGVAKATKTIEAPTKIIRLGAPLAGAPAMTRKPANILKTKTILTRLGSKKKYNCFFIKPVSKNSAKLIINKNSDNTGMRYAKIFST